MNARVRVSLVSLFVVMALAALQVPGAAAYQAGGNLPTYKEPPSARFDITGNLSISGGTGVGNINAKITGNGAMSGGNLQEDITVNVSGGPSGGSTSVTSSVILIGTMYYMKISSPSTPGAAGTDKWYVVDLSKVPGGQNALPGMGGSGLTGIDPKYQAAFHTTQLGKETINGASTTKYQLDVDLPKLLELMGSADPQTVQMLNNAKLVVYMWIGDDDMYVHQTRAVMDVKVSVPNSSDITLALDFLITFKDFGAPITITAPANAEPLDMGTSGTSGSLIFGMPTSFIGGMPSSMPTGMPTTGASDNGGRPPLSLMPLALTALALLCLATGGLLRRRASLH